MKGAFTVMEEHMRRKWCIGLQCWMILLFTALLFSNCAPVRSVTVSMGDEKAEAKSSGKGPPPMLRPTATGPNTVTVIILTYRFILTRTAKFTSIWRAAYGNPGSRCRTASG